MDIKLGPIVFFILTIFIAKISIENFSSAQAKETKRAISSKSRISK